MKKFIVVSILLSGLVFGIAHAATRTQLTAFMTKLNTALVTNQASQERLHAEARLLKAKIRVVQAALDGVGTTSVTLTLPTATEIDAEMSRK